MHTLTSFNFVNLSSMMKITAVYGDLFSKFHILVRVFANTF